MLRSLFQVRRGEGWPTFLAGLLSFLLFVSYQFVRPVRDEISAEELDDLHWLWSGTFVASLVVLPIYVWAAAKFRRGVFFPLLYGTLALQLIGLYLALALGPLSWRYSLEIGFYIWVSVVVMFLTTSFWSLMADRFAEGQGRRLFPMIALGFTFGKLTAAQVVAFLGEEIQNTVPFGLLLLGAIPMFAAGFVAWRIDRESPLGPTERVMRPGVLEAVTSIFRSRYLSGIAAFILLMTLASSVLYIANADVQGKAFPTDGLSEEAARAVRNFRTEFIARIHLGEQIATILLQGLLTAHLIRRFGIGVTLAFLPVVAFFVLVGVGLFPGLLVFATAQAVMPAVRYAVAKPAREVLFTVVTREERYKAKPFLDAPLYRGGDVACGWLLVWMLGVLAGPGEVALYAAPAMLAWLLVAVWLGRRQAERTAAAEPSAS